MTAYLNGGAVSLAAPNWSDATGFANDAALVIDKEFGSGQPVTTAVDQSSLGTGIDSLDITTGAVGQLGTGAAPLQVDADTASTDGISNYGKVKLFFKGGGSGVINNFSCGPNSDNTQVDDTVVQLVVAGGRFEATESAIITNMDAYGGSSEIHYNATGFTLARFMGGTHIIRRVGANIIVGHNAHVIIDLDDAESMTSTVLTNYGGRVTIINGAFPTMTSIGGVVDLSKARRAFTIGGTAITLGGAQIIQGAGLVTLSNIAYVGNSKRSVGNAIAIP